jgi:elongation factor G
MNLKPIIISVALDPKTIADQERMVLALGRLAQEDPTFEVHIDPDSGQTVISGVDELHLEIIIGRLTREYRVEANVEKPRVAYRETIRKSAEAEARYIRHTGGSDNYAHVKIRVEPNEAGKGIDFINDIRGGVVPMEYIKPTERGVRKAMRGGILAGCELIDIKATLFDGSYHHVDSNELAFEIAGSIALKEAARKATPVLLEPVMAVEVVVPEQSLPTILASLNSRRGRIEGVKPRAGLQVVKANVPLSEMLGYTTHLRSSTQGQVSYSMKFHRYEICPTGWFGGDEPFSGVANRKGPPPPRGRSGSIE